MKTSAPYKFKLDRNVLWRKKHITSKIKLKKILYYYFKKHTDLLKIYILLRDLAIKVKSCSRVFLHQIKFVFCLFTLSFVLTPNWSLLGRHMSFKHYMRSHTDYSLFFIFLSSSLRLLSYKHYSSSHSQLASQYSQ